MLPLSPAPAVDLLRGDPSAVALWTDDGPARYDELSARAAGIRAALGTTRRLVMLPARNTAATIAGYLAALSGGHPVLLVPGGDDEPAVRTREALAARFDPDVELTEGEVRPRRDGSAHELHEDLALLMSTSGSTGSPKLVRISGASLLANAAAIVDYLGLTDADRAITSLPMHYCYGLSVVNSHLLAGGGLVLTERSVSDEEFWRRAEEARITGFAGVPYSFDLLDAVGGPDRLPSSIRYVTQAGGRLPVERVRALARAGERRSFAFFTMYGQTEATARMSYLPPADAVRAAGSIGRAIPGGSFRIEIEEGTDAGELVYSGPNVMLGYAQSPADLALGRTVEELRTGDLARWREDGYVEIVGRMNRFVKLFGLRIDLDAVQRELEDAGIPARTAADDEDLLVFVHSEREADRAREVVARRVGIPARSVQAYAVDAFPVTSSGKPDNAALVRHHRTAAASPARAASGPVTAARVRDVLAVCTGRPDATEADGFAALGGDSLSYVEASVQLEELLGTLPRDWPSRSAAELAAAAAPASAAAERQPSRRRAFPAVETPVLLRALAIVLIVGTHADLFRGDGFSLKGGAHLLLVVAGYNVARFALSAAPGARPARLLGATAQVAVPAVLWIGAVALLSGKYALATALLVNNATAGGGTEGRWSEQWQFWFLEAMVWSMLALAALFSVPAVDRLERRAPWAFAVGVLAAAAAVRFAMLGTAPAEHLERYALPTVLWCLALGWLVARADGVGRRVLATLACLALVPGFFGEPLREGIVVLGVLALVWLPAVRVPAPLRPVLTVLASASLFVYLTHWVVYPPFEASAPLLGTLLSFAVGIAAWLLHRRVTDLVRGVRARVAASRA
ncbi:MULTISPECIES: AMP-binding protein [Microbacterium]|uniref:AMP-binding protein n=1 Tax=Microbacterium TaxID=33882 RepID=UPI00217E7FDF|nr:MULTISPECIES: AMP-binding protein [Microbacterium]UWF78392.1 AMP-binding protein [Microbacterium neungamense]WCM56568.1 AMP-binding protein [Microbacterium sp. EF45047]